MGLLLILRAVFWVRGEPLVLGLVFMGLLFGASVMLGIRSGFMGLILFIVYVGGTIVLFTYCLILSPLQFTAGKKRYYILVLILERSFFWVSRVMGVWEFFSMTGVLLMVGLMLFVVILRVVEMVDMSRGALRVE